MKVHTLNYTTDKGWSENTFPKMDSEKTLIFIFASPAFKDNPKPIQELAEYYPQSHIIGCSSSGEISGAAIHDHSLSVAITQFDRAQIKTLLMPIKNMDDSFNSGKNIASDLKGDKLKGIFILSDGLNVNGSELVKGLNTIHDENVVVTGGLAGDGSDFKHTWTVYKGKIQENSIVAVGLYGESIKIGHASQGGWDIFGPERRITRATNNVLYELDGQPALPLYKQYLGERAQGLPATGLLFPLAIRTDKGDKNQLVRTILSVNEKEQSLTFAGDMPNGHLAQLMRANFDRLICSAGQAGDTAIKNTFNQETQKPVLCLAVSCVGRRLLLGERTEEETESVVNALPKGSKMVGFYSYGEISPYTTGTCNLHNQTMTLTTINED